MVCDSMWNCEYYKQSLTVGSVSRRLQEKSVSETFLEDIKHPELIPGTVLMYCESLELEQEAITTMLSTGKEESNPEKKSLEGDLEDRQEEDFGGAEIGIMFLGIPITTIILGVVEIIMKVYNSTKERLGVLAGMLVLVFLLQ